MKKIKVTTNFKSLPLIRQSPKESGIWGDCQFYINEDTVDCDWWVVFEGITEKTTARCSPDNTILVTGEPPGVKRYRKDFLNQFRYILTCQRGIKRGIYRQQSLPWWVGCKYLPTKNDWDKEYTLNYDKLSEIENFEKNKLLTTIVSNKNFTVGHSQRLKFVRFLEKEINGRIDVFGRGRKMIGDKWDGLAQYKYCLVIENCQQTDYWTEKLADAFLAGCYPIYFGCPNIYDYFSKKSLAVIDIWKPREALESIQKILSEDVYDNSTIFIKESRELVLDKYNFFPNIVDLISKLPSGLIKDNIILYAEKPRTRLEEKLFKTKNQFYNFLN